MQAQVIDFTWVFSFLGGRSTIPPTIPQSGCDWASDGRPALLAPAGASAYHAGMTPEETRKALRQLQADAMALHTQTMRLRATLRTNSPQGERLRYWFTIAAGAMVGATISFCLLR